MMGTRAGNNEYLFLQTRIHVKFKVPSIWITLRNERPNALLHRTHTRAALGPLPQGAGIRPRGVGNTAEKERAAVRNLEAIKLIWNPCNPLKSHKTAKAFFGNVWRKQVDIWKCSEKAWTIRLYSAALAPSSRAALATSALTPGDTGAPRGSTARGRAVRRPSRASAGAARSSRRS